VAAIPRRRPTEAIPSPPAADPSQQRETPKPMGWGRETMRRREGATEIGVGLLGEEPPQLRYITPTHPGRLRCPSDTDQEPPTSK
jgi:hypothetical protein